MTLRVSAARVGRIVALLGSVAIASVVGHAQAATLSVSGGTANVIPGSFNPSGTWPSDGIGVGSSISTFNAGNITSGGLFVTPSAVLIEFEFMGTEAGNTNSVDMQLSWNNTALFDNKVAVGYKTGLFAVDVSTSSPPGLVPISFQTNGAFTGNANAVIANGTSVTAGSGLNLSFSEVFNSVAGSWVYAFFGDGLGDSDYDDMIVKIYAYSTGGGVPEVPLPPAVILFGTALVGLTVLGRRRSRRTLAA